MNDYEIIDAKETNNDDIIVKDDVNNTKNDIVKDETKDNMSDETKDNVSDETTENTTKNTTEDVSDVSDDDKTYYTPVSLLEKLLNFIYTSESSSSEEESTEDDEEDSNEESNEDNEEDETIVYLIHCNDKNVRFTKTMKQAKEAMLNEAFLFLESNTLSFFRMDKDENKIIIYERNHDTLFPFLEKVIFKIKIIPVEKY